MTFVKKAPQEPDESSEGDVVVFLESEIYRCTEHGTFRVYISGAIKPFRE